MYLQFHSVKEPNTKNNDIWVRFLFRSLQSRIRFGSVSYTFFHFYISMSHAKTRYYTRPYSCMSLLMFMKFGNLVHRIKYIGVKLQNYVTHNRRDACIKLTVWKSFHCDYVCVYADMFIIRKISKPVYFSVVLSTSYSVSAHCCIAISRWFLFDHSDTIPITLSDWCWVGVCM